MENDERLTAACDRFGHLTKLDHVSIGLSTRHTLSATMRAPSAVG
jgi:hypothetical protein